jgi:putative acetyltransferase
MRIRCVKRTDIPHISRLYYETVHRVNAYDYSPEQIRVWAPQIYPDAFWQRRFRCYRVLVADDHGVIVAFSEPARGGAIDGFYVHRAHQCRGIGSALMARIEREARIRG